MFDSALFILSLPFALPFYFGQPLISSVVSLPFFLTLDCVFKFSSFSTIFGDELFDTDILVVTFLQMDLYLVSLNPYTYTTTAIIFIISITNCMLLVICIIMD